MDDIFATDETVRFGFWKRRNCCLHRPHADDSDGGDDGERDGIVATASDVADVAAIALLIVDKMKGVVVFATTAINAADAGAAINAVLNAKSVNFHFFFNDDVSLNVVIVATIDNTTKKRKLHKLNHYFRNRQKLFPQSSSFLDEEVDDVDDFRIQMIQADDYRHKSCYCCEASEAVGSEAADCCTHFVDGAVMDVEGLVDDFDTRQWLCNHRNAAAAASVKAGNLNEVPIIIEMKFRNWSVAHCCRQRKMIEEQHRYQDLIWFEGDRHDH